MNAVKRGSPEMWNALRRAAQALHQTEATAFSELLRIASFPREALRGTRWCDVSFDGHDLRGLNFTAAKFPNCTFADALIEGADFSDAEVTIIQLRGARDWDAYVLRAPDPRHRVLRDRGPERVKPSIEDRSGLIDYLVDGPRDEKGRLRAHYLESMAQQFARKLFFIRGGRRLHKRARPIFDLARQATAQRKLAATDLPSRSDLSAFTRKEPVTLSAALRLYRFFEWVSESGDIELQELCRTTGAQGKPVTFRIGENDIIPSTYQAVPSSFRRAREALGYKKIKFGELLFKFRSAELLDLLEGPEPPCVTYYFARTVFDRLRDVAANDLRRSFEVEEVGDLFHQAEPESLSPSLMPEQGNIVPDEHDAFRY